MKLWILALGWVIYFLFHSLMATKTFKTWAKPVLGNYSRLFYSVFSTIGLVILLILNGSLASPKLLENTDGIRYLSLMFTTFGVMTVQLAFRQYRVKSFVGFAEENDVLKIEGILKHVRHPIYSGTILITIGFFLFIPTVASAVSCLCILGYLPIGIYLEEKKLVAAFGEDYLRYKKEVPSLFPRIFSRKS